MTRMTNEQATRLVDFCDKYAWYNSYKVPHLTHDELSSEFQMVCLKIFNKYGFEENLFKKACHARAVDLVRYNVKHGEYALDDLSLDLIANSEDTETSVSEQSYHSKSFTESIESEMVMKGLIKYLLDVLDPESKEYKYVMMRAHLEGVCYDDSLSSLIYKTQGAEGQIACELGYANGASSGGYKNLRYKIQVMVAYFMHVKGYEEYLPEDWRNLGDEYYTHRFLKKAKSVLAE